MRATYRCDKCGMKIVLSEGATYCPNCGGRLRIILGIRKIVWIGVKSSIMNENLQMWFGGE